MTDQSIREALEKSIIDKSWQINISKRNPEWVHDPEVEVFLDAWYALRSYYAEHPNDTVIGVEVLKAYLDYTRLLRKILQNDEVEVGIRERAEEIIESLEGELEWIITEVVTYLSG
jgi:hypothetical protein